LLATELADEGVKGRREEKAKAGYAQHMARSIQMSRPSKIAGY
jgi:hypothetical protein